MFQFSFIAFLVLVFTGTAYAASVIKLDTDLGVSTSTKTSYQSIFCGYKVRAAYTGPIVKLRKGLVEQDFYGNYNLSTGNEENNVSLKIWLGGERARVVVWYDQSDNGRHATQYDRNLQPYFDVHHRYLDFKPTSLYLNVPGTIFPVGNNAYSFVLQHGAIGNENGAVFAVGHMDDNYANAFRRVTQYNMGNGKYEECYVNYWWGPQNFYARNIEYAEKNVISVTHTGALRTMYINGVAFSSEQNQYPHQYIQQDGRIGRQTHSDDNVEALQGELYFLMTSNIAIPEADRTQLETSAPIIADIVLPSLQPTLQQQKNSTVFIVVLCLVSSLLCVLGGWFLYNKFYNKPCAYIGSSNCDNNSSGSSLFSVAASSVIEMTRYTAIPQGETSYI